MSIRLYALPMVLGDQYILSNVIRETENTVTYAATQKDMRREVLVETLRPEARKDPAKERFFLDSARVRASIPTRIVASTLELFEAEGTWHLALEKVKGEPLDIMISSGRKLPSFLICTLFLELCRSAIYLDIRHLRNHPLRPESIYLMEHDFRFENVTCAGERPSTATRDMLATLAEDILPLLDTGTAEAWRMGEILNRVHYGCNWTPLSALSLDEELVRLQADIAAHAEPHFSRSGEGESAAASAGEASSSAAAGTGITAPHSISAPAAPSIH